MITLSLLACSFLHIIRRAMQEGPLFLEQEETRFEAFLLGIIITGIFLDVVL
jgi:hypothetical protein